MAPPLDIESLIERAGSLTKLARIAGVGATAVIHWRNEGFVPGKHLFAISTELNIPMNRLIVLLRPKHVPWKRGADSTNRPSRV